MIKKTAYLAENVIRLYFINHISRASAALSYFFMLSLFPLLICLNSMLGSLFPTAEEFEGILRGMLPVETVNTLMDYLAYVSSNSSHRMVTVALVALATSSAAGFRIVDKVMNEIRRVKKVKKQFAFFMSFVYSLVFLSAIYFAALLIASGGWFINFIDENVKIINISKNWEWFRFLLLFFVLFIFILGAYRLCSPKKSDTLIVPGAFWASFAIVAVSFVFSWFIGISIKYPLIYGSLASVMVMLLWLYIFSNLLFLGNILNTALEKINEART
ncbi:MAG: YihY family inner membrane protein [Ruminococcaceae bacterium]|nr:YihY family inner membrane protein [Oscillospiraceae bacterium]